MFKKGTMRDIGIDVTLKNNPGHILAPDNVNVLMDFRFGKLTPEKFREYYLTLLKNRWDSHKELFITLAKKGKSEDIILKCTCGQDVQECHANLASKFLNKLITRL